MTLGLYIHANSVIHKTPAKFKLIITAIAGLVVFLVSNIFVLISLLGLVILLFFIAHLPWRNVILEVRSSIFLLSTIFIFHCIFTNWIVGLFVILRFSILIFTALIVSFTTRVSAMIETIEYTLKPLSIFGINSSRISMALLMAIRFIPVLLDQVRDIQEAQRARGIERNIVALLIPLFIKTLHVADDLTDALNARCYDDG